MISLKMFRRVLGAAAFVLVASAGSSSAEVPANYHTSDLGEVTASLNDTTGKPYHLTASISLAVSLDRPDRQEALWEVNARGPQLVHEINTLLIGTDLSPLLSDSSAVRLVRLNTLREEIMRSVNGQMENTIDAVFFRDFIIHDIEATPDSRIVIVPRGAEIPDASPDLFFSSLLISGAFWWALAWFAAMLCVARPREIFSFVRREITFRRVTAETDGRFRGFAAESGMLVGVLLTTLDMIATLAGLGTGGLNRLLALICHAHAAVFCGIIFYLLLKRDAVFNPRASFAGEPRRGGWILPSAIALWLLHSLGLGIETFVNWPAALVIVAPIVMGRIFHDSTIAERTRLAVGYIFLATGNLNVIFHAVSPRPELYDMGVGVALAFISAIFMTAGSLLARIRAMKAPQRPDNFPSIWWYPLTLLFLVDSIAIIMLTI